VIHLRQLAPNEREAIEQAAQQFNITPARRNKIAVTRLEERKRGE
jgi:hypothetical protein